MVAEGITTGYQDGTFRPTGAVTRQALAAYIFRYNYYGLEAPRCTEAPFPDVPVDSPFCGQIAWMAYYGLAQGYPDGTFRPNASVSRQAAAAFLERYTFYPDRYSEPTRFPDVGAGPFCTSITFLSDGGIAEGYSDGTFRPTAEVTRQAIAAYLYRLDALFESAAGAQLRALPEGSPARRIP